MFFSQKVGYVHVSQCTMTVSTHYISHRNNCVLHLQKTYSRIDSDICNSLEENSDIIMQAIV